MTAGLRIWNASGGLVLDTSTLVMRTLGSLIATGGGSGSVTDAGLLTGTPWWAQMGAGVNFLGGAIVSVSGSTLSWSWSGYPGVTPGTPPNVLVFYGVR